MTKTVFKDTKETKIGKRRKSTVELTRAVAVTVEEADVKVAFGTYGKGPRGGDQEHPMVCTLGELRAIVDAVEEAAVELRQPTVKVEETKVDGLSESARDFIKKLRELKAEQRNPIGESEVIIEPNADEIISAYLF